MLALPVGDGMDTDVSPRARTAIATLKARLADLVTREVTCHADPKAIAARLSSLFPPAKNTADARYASTVAFEMSRHGPDKIGIVATFSIACGEDAMLMLFQHTPDHGWHEAMRLQSKPYDTVAGGYWSFDYRVSPPDNQGNWFVVQKNVAPWCSSTWSEIRYSVARPSQDPMQPRILLDRAESMWWGSEDFGRLSAASDGFTLRFHSNSIDSGVHNREWVRRYRVGIGAVTRRPPLAYSARDFAEEWIQSKWSDIAAWTANPGLHSLHDALNKTAYFDYASVYRCGATTWIEVTDDAARTPTSWFFLVGGPDFRMLDVRRTAGGRCKGPNLFDMDNP